MKLTCKAKAKSTGTQCKNPPVADTGVCRIHGGKAALANRGKGNASYKHGRYSRIFKDAKLQDRFDMAMSDPELLEHKRDVAILDALLLDTLDTLEGAAATEDMWKGARKLALEIRVANASKDYRRRDENIARLEAHIEEGYQVAHARAEARQIIQERSVVTKRELDRLLKLSGVLTAEQAMILFQALMNEVSTIKDADDRARISNNLIKMAGGKA